MADRILDAVGVKRATTPVESIAQQTASGAAGALSGASAAQTIADAARSPVTRAIASRLAEGPVRQTLSGATGGMAAETAKQAGAGPLIQATAGMAGAGLPNVGGIAHGGLSAIATPPSEAARNAVESGYTLLPAEIVPLGDKPDIVSRTFSGIAGERKLQQAASVRNQVTTNGLAAEAIGLPRGTPLTEAAFNQAEAPAAAIYRQVETAVPEVTFDRDFARKAGNVGGKNSLVEAFFPSTAGNPGIEALRAELAGAATVPTKTAMQYAADLRFNASANLAAPGDAAAHRLGLAQREAADLVEDQISRAVREAPAYYATRFNEALTAQREAASAITEAATALTQARAKLATTQGNVYAEGSARRAQEAAQQRLEQAHAQFDRATKAVEARRAQLQTAHAADADNQTLPDRFQQARQLFARIYDVRDATNRTTGDVNAAVLARMFNRGKPLTGQLKTIADTFNIAPKSMQVPSAIDAADFGPLDFFGALGAAATGHPAVAGAIAGRPFVKYAPLSGAYQRALVGIPGPAFSPLPMFSPAMSVLSGAVNQDGQPR
jgi:hypothetical protein